MSTFTDLMNWTETAEALAAERSAAERASITARSDTAITARDLAEAEEEARQARRMHSDAIDKAAATRVSDAKERLRHAEAAADAAKAACDAACARYEQHAASRPMATPAMLAQADEALSALSKALADVERKASESGNIAMATARREATRIAALHSLGQADDEQLTAAHAKLMRAGVAEGLQELRDELTARSKAVWNARADIRLELRHAATKTAMAKLAASLEAPAIRKAFDELVKVAPGARLEFALSGVHEARWEPVVMRNNA